MDVGSVMGVKAAMLREHRSQQEWLDVSQGMGLLADAMEEGSRAVGRLSGRYEFAEGWTRHLHQGYCAPGADPLRAALGASCSYPRSAWARRPGALRRLGQDHRTRAAERPKTPKWQDCFVMIRRRGPVLMARRRKTKRCFAFLTSLRALASLRESFGIIEEE